MARRLASARRLYNEMAAEPMAYLEAAFPLLADQERFVMLVLWQQDLAERLASLKGHDKEDNPALKARMRDLEEEQRQVRDALARLLDDIQEHIDKLPEKPELKELRETAQEFVKKRAGERGVGGDGRGRGRAGRVRRHARLRKGQGGRRHPGQVPQ